MGVDRAVLISSPDRGLEPAEARAFQDYARRRVQREPVAYILGRKGFRRIELEVDSRVLIPRPETEHVVEAALDAAAGRAGGRRRHGVGRDRAGAGRRAARPADHGHRHQRRRPRRGAGQRGAAGSGVEFVEGDLLDGVSGPIDAVVSNPPYVVPGANLSPEISRHEPAVALYGGAEGLDVYRRLAPAAAVVRVRRVRGRRAGRPEAVARAAAAAGFMRSRSCRDLAGIDRVVVGRR